MNYERDTRPRPRPIGSVVYCVFPPSNALSMNHGIKVGGATTSPSGDCFTVWQYTITAHDKIIDGGIGERLDPVCTEDNPRYFHPIGWEVFREHLSPIPPDEILPLLPEHWRGPVRFITYTEPNSR